MSNSKLICYTKLSPNCTKPRNHKIDTITIHHMAGNLSVESCGEVFASTTRQASSNYGIGTDGRVGLYVEEENRSWCSSSRDNDSRAITIEVSNDEVGGNWHVSDRAFATLIDLCVDICQRNGIGKLNFTGGKDGNLTMHKWFANTQCPGPYLESRFADIANLVNSRLNEKTETELPKVDITTTIDSIRVGDVVGITGSEYYGGKPIPAWVKAKKWIVSSVNGDCIVIDKSTDGKNAIRSPIKASDLAIFETASTEENHSTYTVVRGDSLWMIAKKLLGNGSRYTEIRDLNGLKSNMIYCGQKLKLPNK